MSDAEFSALVDVLECLTAVDVRVGGGWGVDVLAGRVTRAHHDVDLFVAEADLPLAARRLEIGPELAEVVAAESELSRFGRRVVMGRRLGGAAR